MVEQRQEWQSEAAGEFDSAHGALDSRIQARLGRELRAIYEDVVSDPLPDHIKEALERLERQQSKKEAP